jgi:hypothetical protein
MRRIVGQFQGRSQAAFIRRFDTAESAEDLRILLSNAYRLDARAEAESCRRLRQGHQLRALDDFGLP